MSRSKYKNLILIGNGFDRWQDIPSSYENFRQYYLAHIEQVAKELGCSFYSSVDDKGEEKKVTAVELIYGNPFAPKHLEADFFWNLEARLDGIDDQIINLYFGREKEGIEKLNKAVEEAVLLIQRLFSDWVVSLDISSLNSGYRLTDDCFVINFNYTDTVEKRFGISPQNVYHIHGSAQCADTIIVGHASHPEMAFKELIERRFIKPLDPSKGLPRIDGLYAIENALYKTDKHTADNIDQLCKTFVERGVHIEDIEHIYVLGHSFAKADYDYFEFIDQVTKCGCNYEKIAPVGHLDMRMLGILSTESDLADDLLLNQIFLNIAYAMHHRNRLVPDAEDFFPELQAVDELYGKSPAYRENEAAKAVKQRFWFEQAARTQSVLEEIAEKYRVSVPEGCHSILGYMDYKDYGHDRRRQNAQWHISYFSPQDKKRIQSVMKSLHQKRYTLYSSIDQCIAKFSTQ